jgi:hypothetical protein
MNEIKNLFEQNKENQEVEEFIERLENCNNDTKVHYCMVQMTLPKILSKDKDNMTLEFRDAQVSEIITAVQAFKKRLSLR